MDREITGEDVIGVPGQNLSLKELQVLVGLADGETPTTISRTVQADRIELRRIESNLQKKLGGKTKTHTIARGFILGVLIPRALCFMLAVITAFGAFNDEANRTRRPGNNRTKTSITRIVKSGRTGSGDGKGIA